ncbi:hypothetical protein Sliba_79080 [Streptomyces nigrescens]|uniref:Uncharacterized protein n=1 Tax=Streptomyces nigrescens TaxID=1920 RepID=A0A640TZF0_STRNI|nr:hypothetical protein Sliba_79080 [Streptomyces libani subsp. libani]
MTDTLAMAASPVVALPLYLASTSMSSRPGARCNPWLPAGARATRLSASRGCMGHLSVTDGSGDRLPGGAGQAGDDGNGTI